MRELAGKTGAILCILISLALLDYIVSRFREPLNVFNMLSGTSVEIGGPLQKGISIDQLNYRTTSPDIRISFKGVQSGFWFGGSIWSGELWIGPRASPGEYRITVRSLVNPRQKADFQIIVHPGPDSYRQSFKSLFRRYLGFSPWWAIAFLFPLAVTAFVAVFLLSRKIELAMGQSGRAEIYRVTKGIAGYEILFSLGTKHGLSPGTCVALSDKKGRHLGEAEVQKSTETDSLAMTGLDSRVRPGCFVSLIRKQPNVESESL